MFNNIQIFEKDNFKVKTKLENGEVLLNIEDVLRAIKGKYIQVKNDKEYIRWANVNADLSKFNFPTLNGKGDFIPESAAYLLIMNGDNELALQFQIWLATEVIPSIRKYGAYIAPDADKETVDKLEKFSKYRIKRTFTNATKENIESLYNDFLGFIPTMRATDSITAISSAIKGISDFRANVDSDAYKMLTLEKIKELTDIKATKQNRVNGAIKSHKTRKINNLSNFAARMENEAIALENELEEWKQYANDLYPSPEEFITIPVHPFSFNYMFKTLEDDIKVKTEDYKTWIKMFPKVDWPELSSNKYYDVFLEFGAISAFDTDNLIKATLDQIVRDTNLEDDNNFIGVTTYKTIVDNYKDGFIRVCLKEIN